MPERNNGLCYRCDHRASVHESGKGVRDECMELNSTVGECYAYRPVQPLVLEQASMPCHSSLRSPYGAAVKAKGLDDTKVMKSAALVGGALAVWWGEQ